ncbi:hypothetical protein D4764_12G0006490, partial [Takifugu flavidus]
SGIFVLLLTQCGLSSELSGVTTELGHGKDVDVCPEGKYFSHQFCLECPSGHYCPGKASAPRRCPPGTFNLHTGKSTLGDCKCGPGKEPNIEKTSCNDCLPGFYSTVCTIQCLECPAAPRWSQPAIRSSQTIICRPGTYKDIKEGMTCVICPAGHYCVGGVAIPCPAGTYGAQEGLQNLRECTICPAAHRDPPPTSCAHRGFSVKRAPLALTGHLARLVLQGNNWVRQVGQPSPHKICGPGRFSGAWIALCSGKILSCRCRTGSSMSSWYLHTSSRSNK